MKLFQGPGRLLSLDLTYASNFSYLALVDMLLILGDHLNVDEEKEGTSDLMMLMFRLLLGVPTHPKESESSNGK